jgi:hypothetical protein
MMSILARLPICVLLTMCGCGAVSAQTPPPQPAPLTDANKNGLVGLYSIKELCSEKNPSKKPQIENNFANQLTRASPELKAWAGTAEFKKRLATRKAEQRQQMKQPVGAELMVGFCENLTK